MPKGHPKDPNRAVDICINPLCPKSGVEQPIDVFSWNDKAKGVRRGECRICRNTPERREKELIRGRTLRRRECHAIWRNSLKGKAYNVAYAKTPKARIAQKRYRQNNKRAIIAHVKNRLTIDIQFHLSCNLRSRLNRAIKNNQKSGSAVNDLGCKIFELKLFLESKFLPGMSWDNYGNKKGQWSIDHIIPLSSFDLANREQFLRACHYTNLQPMWVLDNIKKSNKILF